MKLFLFLLHVITFHNEKKTLKDKRYFQVHNIKNDCFFILDFTILQPLVQKLPQNESSDWAT